MRATDAAGNLSAYSQYRDGDHADAPTPGADGADRPDGHGGVGTQINLSWTASTDNVGVTGYLVERCQGAGCTTFAQIGDAGRDDVQRHGADRRARPTAIGCAPPTRRQPERLLEHRHGATTAAPTPGADGADGPDGDGGVSSADQSDAGRRRPTTSGSTGYLVERCQGAGCTTFAQWRRAAATTFSDTGLTTATSYSYRVRATDAAAT